MWKRKVKSVSEVAQSSPTLSDPMDCSPPGSSIHGIFQARVLEWGAIAFSCTLKRYYQFKEDADMQRCTLFFSSFLEFHVPGKTHDSYYCWTAHTHKSCQNCLKVNPQLLYQHEPAIIFQILLQKKCFIITSTSQWIIQMNSTESHTHTHTHTHTIPPIIYM